jgi:outer membrane receptor protein involved in Fe transport
LDKRRSGQVKAMALLLLAEVIAPFRARADDSKEQAVTPSAPPHDQDFLTAQDIAELNQFSLEDLLTMPVWKVTTASKREESSSAAPATVFVVTREDIYLRGYSTLIDVLKDLPGMEITDYAYAPIGTQVAVRGVVGNNKLIVLVNGMRVNPPGGDPMMIHSDFSVREAEQIEIIYGPGSTLYGQDVINAVINVKTKKAGGEHWIDVGASAGYPWRHESWLGLNRKVGEAEINGYLQYSDATLTNREKEFPDEWATYQPSYANVPQGQTIMHNPKRWDRGLNGFLQLTQGNFSTQLWHRQSWRSSSEGMPGWPFLNESKWTDVATVADAKYTFKLAEDVSLSSALTFNRFEVLPESAIIIPVGDRLSVEHKYSMETSFTLEETVAAKIGQRISLLGGFVYGHYDIIPLATVPAGLNTSADVSSQAGTIDYYTTLGDPSSKVSINKVNNPVYQSVGLYAEGTFKLHDRVRALAGIRLDKDERYSEVPISPRFALIVNPRADLTLKAIFTEAFVQPAAYYMFDVYAPSFVNTTNLDLKPEQARSFEINAEFRRDNILASLSGYYNTQRNLLLANGIFSDSMIVSNAIYRSPDPAAPSVVLLHDSNGGNNRTYGGDIFGRYSLAGNRVAAWGSYSYVDSEMKNILNGVEVKTGLPGLAHHNFRLGATINIIPSKFFATLGLWLHSTPQNVNNFSPSPYVVTSTLKGSAEWPYEASLNLIYRLKAGAEAFATLKNFTNRHNASVYSGNAYPGETFHGIIGLRFRN